MIAAIAFPVMLGFVGLATEVATWLLTQRVLQGVADAAAFSAGIAYAAGNHASYGTEGIDVAAQDGVADGVAGTTVTIATPPQDGNYDCDNATDCGNYLEARITRIEPTLITRLPPFSLPSVTITAHAVVSLAAPGGDCVLALNATNSGAVTLNGNANVNLSCGLAVDSSSASALLLNGGSTLTAASASIVGNVLNNGGTFSTPDTQTSAASVSDPYKNINPPSFSGCNYTNKVFNGVGGTLSPGVYCGTLLINGNGFTVNVMPGTYIFDRASLVINGSPTVTSNGAGVSFIFTSSTGSNVGTLSVNGTPTLNLTAETSGPTAGLLFYQDRRASPSGANVFNGAPGSTLTGALYFPNQAVTYNGLAQQGPGCTQVVAQTITFNGAPQLAVDNCAGAGVQPIGSSLGKLVE